MRDLEIKAQRVLQFIAGHLEAHDGISPTYEQIGDFLGSGSKGHASRYVSALKQAGAISTLERRARSFSVNAPVTIPRAPDGEPLYFIEVR